MPAFLIDIESLFTRDKTEPYMSSDSEEIYESIALWGTRSPHYTVWRDETKPWSDPASDPARDMLVTKAWYESDRYYATRRTFSLDITDADSNLIITLFGTNPPSGGTDTKAAKKRTDEFRNSLSMKQSRKQQFKQRNPAPRI